MLNAIESLSNLFGGKGYRTYVSAIVAAFVAFNHLVPIVPADLAIPMLAMASMLGFYSADESPAPSPAASGGEAVKA